MEPDVAQPSILGKKRRASVRAVQRRDFEAAEGLLDLQSIVATDVTQEFYKDSTGDSSLDNSNSSGSTPAIITIKREPDCDEVVTVKTEPVSPVSTSPLRRSRSTSGRIILRKSVSEVSPRRRYNSTKSTLSREYSSNSDDSSVELDTDKIVYIDNGTPGKSKGRGSWKGKSKNPSKVLKAMKSKAHRPALESDEELQMMEASDRYTKAAIQARISRQRKKAYIMGLEDKIQMLVHENKKLKVENEDLMTDKSSLKEEIVYLKSVLANQSSLAKLLKNIDKTEGVSLRMSASLIMDRRQTEMDHDYGKPVTGSKKKRPWEHSQSVVPGGVCLHVKEENVSLEFCAKCAKMAKNTVEVASHEENYADSL